MALRMTEIEITDSPGDQETFTLKMKGDGAPHGEWMGEVALPKDCLNELIDKLTEYAMET
jgi:hypothetical protein